MQPVAETASGMKSDRRALPLTPERILLIRLSAIGDLVFSSPLIAALRRAYPQARISWLVQPECAPLLRHHPDLDEVITWPLQEWRQLWRERRGRELWRRARDLRGELRRRRFDLVLDLQGLLKSGLPAWLTGARERIGLGSREGSQWLMTCVLPRGGDPRTVGSEYRFLAERLGLPLADFAMQVVPGEKDRDYARALIARLGLAGGYAVICPFTTRPQKHWFADRWAGLARDLRQELGLPVLMLGGPGDRQAARRIQDLVDQNLVDRGQASVRDEDLRRAPGTSSPRADIYYEASQQVEASHPAPEDESQVPDIRYQAGDVRGKCSHPSPDEKKYLGDVSLGEGLLRTPLLVNLAGETSLLQAAALIEACRLLIGVDTGLSHMGLAFGRPSLLLFGSTRPYLDPGPQPGRVLYHPLPCSPCKRRPSCRGAFTCMRLIEGEEVLRQARLLVAGRGLEEKGWEDGGWEDRA